MLTEEQQQKLRFASRSPNHILFGTVNERLNEVIDEIMKESPASFWTRDELRERNFFHEPRQVVDGKSFVIPCVRFAMTIKKD